MDKIIITISREYASGGRLVGEKLAERLGITFYDRKLIELAAEKSGLSPTFIEKSEEQATPSFLYNLAASAHSSAGYLWEYHTPVSDKAFFAQSAVIRELAERESCVILGRCAGYILREEPGCINVFLHGSLDDRLERAVNVYGMESKGLADKLVKIDRGRTNYHRYHTGENWYDVRAYDLVIDTSASGIDGAAECIAALAGSLK